MNRAAVQSELAQLVENWWIASREGRNFDQWHRLGPAEQNRILREEFLPSPEGREWNKQHQARRRAASREWHAHRYAGSMRSVVQTRTGHRTRRLVQALPRYRIMDPRTREYRALTGSLVKLRKWFPEIRRRNYTIIDGWYLCPARLNFD